VNETTVWTRGDRRPGLPARAASQTRAALRHYANAARRVRAAYAH
jgi:hypothetical protein